MAQQKASSKKSKKTVSSPSKKASTPVAVKKAKRPDEPKVKLKGKAPENKAVAKKTQAAEPVKETRKEKVVSTLTKSDLQYFRNLLLEKRREILGDVGSMESEAFKGGSNLSNMPIHMADVGTDNFEQEFTLGLIESERQILREIQEALIRLDNGSFGICQGTNKVIPRVRLEAV